MRNDAPGRFDTSRRVQTLPPLRRPPQPRCSRHAPVRLLVPQVPRARLVGYSRAPRQPLPNLPADFSLLLAPIDLLWDPGQRTARRVQPACVDEDCD